MRIHTILIVLMVAGVVAADLAAAQGWGPWVGEIVYSDVEASLVIVPDGTGPAMSEAWNYGGIDCDASIRVELVDGMNDPIMLFPREDIWLEFESGVGTVTSCFPEGDLPSGGVFTADAMSDADGWTEFTLPRRGGGWSDGVLRIYINGALAEYLDWIPVPSIPLRMNSPDINGDLRVDLTDVAFFVQGFSSYHYRCDLYWDGQINLSDLAFFVPHLGVVCD
jgi:hypothetical protein